MEWEIIPFVGMGLIKFGMSTAEVAAQLGSPQRKRENGNRIREARSRNIPIIYYRDGVASEIEAFYDVDGVSLKGINIFGQSGREVMRSLEAMNGGAKINVGAVLFANIGIMTGRLDEEPRGNHSVTAFRQGLWDDQLDKFKPISFL